MISKQDLNTYRVVFTDGHIEYIEGRYAAHAWANANFIWPHKQIKDLSLIILGSENADEIHGSKGKMVV